MLCICVRETYTTGGETSTVVGEMCNGLVEKFNGTLRKMCAVKPKDWDRYINPLLFAYREVRQQRVCTI